VIANRPVRTDRPDSRHQSTELAMSAKIDRNSIPRTYRDYIEKLKSMGEMREIDDEVD
jgi:hypothetical protein